MDTEPDRHDEHQGRFILLTGPGADTIAPALAGRLPKAATVDGATVAAMFAAEATPGLEAMFLRYTAGIALADSFRLAGFDAVVAEDVPDDHLEAYLDFASPATVFLVRLGADDDRPGLAVPGGNAGDDTVATILARLEEARVDPSPETTPRDLSGSDAPAQGT